MHMNNKNNIIIFIINILLHKQNIDTKHATLSYRICISTKIDS